jgi:aspartate-semialdehyde dehydrogenase
MQRYNVGIVGATGIVGQRLIQRLADHPWFDLAALAASERSAGKRYGDAAAWRLSGDPPKGVADLPVKPSRAEQFEGCDLVLSALDAATARELEPRLAAAGLAVISNSSALRQRADVPLLIPEINPMHAELIERQSTFGTGGYVVTNPNCSTTGLALVLAPLHAAFGVRRLVVATLQALSGAGIDGPNALDVVDNVLPFIPGEEEKIEIELGKIFGVVDRGRIRHASLEASAHCHRVGTLDGHLAALSVELERVVEIEEVSAALAEYRGAVSELGLPSAPVRPLCLRAEPDRPQPRLDREAGNGMSVVVGRIRRCSALGVKLELLSHNTIRGAAGGTLLNAELLAAKGLLPRRAKP